MSSKTTQKIQILQRNNMSSHYITQLFLFFVFSPVYHWALPRYKKNKRYILKNKNEVPLKFKDKISLEEHQKAADYSIAKINTSNYFNVLNTAVLLGWTYFGGLDVLDSLCPILLFELNKPSSRLHGLFLLISMVLGLPESLYSTFVLRRKIWL